MTKSGETVVSGPGDALWYKDAVIYEVPVKAFFDSDNDGIGDLRGLISKLDYIKDLGANTVWLLPFYPSPMRDDGYDISDYRNIAPEYGTRADFRLLVRELHHRDMRVITELVLNHTSDAHAWFQAARRAPHGSVKRDYYVWSDDDKKYAGTRRIFSDTESSNWTWDPVAGAYFWHRFFSHQPDLNFDNPHMLQAVLRNMRFWLDMGVDGFRLDAVAYLCEREGTSNENLPETHAVLRRLRAELDRHYVGRMLLAEANQWPEDVREYFGESDECHMAYHFPLMPRIYMAVASEDRHPVVEILRQTPEIPASCQWATFLRNHDELTLEKVTDRERDYLYNAYAADPRARLNLGIRRRLAPLMENDRRKIELMTVLLMTLPGSPVIYYGDEIGMGDNIYLGDRNGVRTPMQWSPDRNGGFSRADPQQLCLPVNTDAVYGAQTVNVESQLRSPSSLLNWMKRLIAVRNAHRAFGRGSLVLIEPGNRKILAYLREYLDETILCVVNLSRTPQAVEIDLSRYAKRVPVELTARTAFPPVRDTPYFLTMPGYGFFLFRLSDESGVPEWREERVPRVELQTLVMPDGWATLFGATSGSNRVRQALADRTRAQWKREVLTSFLASRRWFETSGNRSPVIEILEHAEWEVGGRSWLLALLSVTDGGEKARECFLPMSIDWGDTDDIQSGALRPWALAYVRQQDRVGLLYEAFGDDAFCHALVAAMAVGVELPFAGGTLRLQCNAGVSLSGDDAAGPIRRLLAQRNDIGIFFGSTLYLKIYPAPTAGVSADVELGRVQSEVAPYASVPAIVGTLALERANGATTVLGVLQRVVENQGDCWDYTIEYLERHFDDHAQSATLDQDTSGPGMDVHAQYCLLAGRIGQRTAEMHLALAAAGEGAALATEAVTAPDVEAWTLQAVTELDQVLAHIRVQGQRHTAVDLKARGGQQK